jgi:hypothetical protein
MDAQRFALDNEAIAVLYNWLETEVEEVPAAMIFNMNETGRSEWSDAHSVRVMVQDSCHD